jgi:hypothetical protein
VAFDQFWQDFSTLYDLNFPLQTIRKNRNIHKLNNYMTAGLLISRKRKLELYKIYLNSRSLENNANYKQYRNIYNTLIRLSKKLYFEKNLQTHTKNSKKTWDLLKEAIKSNNRPAKIDQLKSGDILITDQQRISNEFNKFFSEVGVHISNSINPTSLDPEDFVPPNPNPPTLELGLTSPATVFHTIQNFQAKLSCDLEGISMQLLKAISHTICTPLSHIFNLSIQTGIFPEKLKKSRTVPIFKSGDPELCDNYRPISLLSSLSKVLEKMVSIQLVNHIELNHLLYEHQYGFQKNKSTEHNLTHLSNYIYSALNEKKYCIGIFLDLKKSLRCLLARHSTEKT